MLTNCTVCQAVVEYADEERAQWVGVWGSALGGHAQAKILPYCLDTATVSVQHFDPLWRPKIPISSDLLLHIVFIDDRSSPDVPQMLTVARLANGTRVRFVALIHRPTAKNELLLLEAGFLIRHLELRPQRADCLHAGLLRLVPKGSKMRGAALFKPMLHWLLPDHIHHALILDTDTVPLRPLDALLDEIPKMRSKGALIGLVREQSRFYRAGGNFHMAPGMRGYNGGVQLHDLASMRASSAWGAALDALQAGLLYSRIGYSGDQNIYNLLVSLFPHLFHTLGCQWNRQVGSWQMATKLSVRRDLEEDAAVHACEAQCALLHFNSFKCGAHVLQAASGSCAAWNDLLEEFNRTSHNCEGPKCRRNQTSGDCPDPRSQLYRVQHLRDDNRLGGALQKWFGSCCIQAAGI